MAYFLTVLTLICLFVPAAIPQSLPLASTTQDARSIAFGVFNKDGLPIPDLRQEQFNITENGQPIKLIGVESSAKLPLRLGILIDSSNSSRSDLTNEKQAANFLAGKLIHSPDDRAFVIAFDEVWDLVQDFTNDSPALKKKIDGIKAGGATAVWDVLYYASRDKLRGQANDAPVRRVIILLSDGNDNQSHVTRDEALKMALQAGVTIYVIAPEAGRSEDILRKIAGSTGGECFFPEKPAQWSAAVNRLSDDLQDRYLATFLPSSSAADKEFHDLKISVDDPALKIHAPKGYFTSKPKLTSKTP